MNYIIYCRKSSESEEKQALSIPAQESELLRLAQRDNLTVVKMFQESMSAKAPARPLFDEMMAFIEKQKGCALLVWKLDRLARNALDGGKLSWFMDRGLIQEIRTPEKIYRNVSDDKFMMSLEFGMAKKYVDDLSIVVKRGMKLKLERGGYPFKAPFGYVNDIPTKSLIPDPLNSKYLRRAVELYATGGYSINDLCDILYEEGLRNRSGGKVKAAVMHRVLRSPFYYGITSWQGKDYEGNHQPLITKELHDQVQELLDGKHQSKKQKLFFHLRGYLRCKNCNCMLTATQKKGHDYYYCTNGKGKCEEKHKGYLRSETLDGFVASLFERMQIDEELIELAYEGAKEKSQHKNKYSDAARLTLDNQLISLRERQMRLLTSYTDGKTPEALYNEKILELTNDETALRLQIKKINQQSQHVATTLEPIKNVFLRANAAQKDYLDSLPTKKRLIAEKLLSNLFIGNKEMASFQLKMPYQLLATGTKITTLSQMRSQRESNSRLHRERVTS